MELTQAFIDTFGQLKFKDGENPAAPFIPIVSTLLKRSELNENLAIYNRIQRLEVVGGAVRYKAAFTATAE